MSTSGNPYDEMLKMAEVSLRDTVAKLGNTHPEVYKMLVQYIAILRQCGKGEQADKLETRAKALKDILDREAAEKGQGAADSKAAEEAKAAAAAKAAEDAKAAEAARAAEAAKIEQAKRAEAARAAEKEQEDALARMVMQSQGLAPKQSEQDKKAELAKKAEKAKAAAEEGVFDLDMFEDEDEESMAMALELVKETPPKPAAKAAEPVAVSAGTSDEPLFLFNSNGEHIAVAMNKALYNPQGQNIGRLLEDYDVYLDRNGWYLGQIVEENRLARDVAWIHRHLNFGDRGNEGDCASWGRIADIGRTYFDRGFEDVKLDDD